MRKNWYLLRKIGINKVFLIIEVFFVIVFSFLNLAVTQGSHWAWANLVGSDGANSVLSAISHNYGLGVPYKDYWEYRPPGFIMLVDYWVKIFGFRIFTFKLFELIFRFGIGLEILLLARKIFSPFQALVVSFLTCFIFFSPLFGTMMLAEPYGLFFSLLGLLILLYLKGFKKRFFFAAFFLFLSGQMKDPYFLSILAFIPVFSSYLLSRDYRSFFKALAFTMLGFLSVFLILWTYVMSLGSWGAYVEIFLFKSSNFGVRIWEYLRIFLRQFYEAFWKVGDSFFHFRFASPPVLFFWFLILVFSLFPEKTFLSRVKFRKEKLTFIFPSLTFSLTNKRLNDIIVVFYSIGVFFGFTLNRGFSPHYLSMVIVSMYFFWSIIISSIENSLRVIFKTLRHNIIFLPLMFFLLFPKSSITVQYRHIIFSNIFRQAYTNLTLPDADIFFEKYINSKTSIDDCIISLYGWKSPEIPLYSMRRPCSRIVHANMVNTPSQMIEYREAVLNHPPAAIAYSLEGADMDVLRFDREVINFTKILKNCYKQDMKYTTNGRYGYELYFPVFSDEALKDCVKNNATI